LNKKKNTKLGEGREPKGKKMQGNHPKKELTLNGNNQMAKHRPLLEKKKKKSKGLNRMMQCQKKKKTRDSPLKIRKAKKKSKRVPGPGGRSQAKEKKQRSNGVTAVKREGKGLDHTEPATPNKRTRNE